MAQYIDKSVLIVEIENLLKPIRQRLERDKNNPWDSDIAVYKFGKQLTKKIDFFEVIDPYEQCIQYSSIEDGIKAYAETYSFNIESELFNQLTKEQQVLWRKEIEQACISGGEMGIELARDTRYKETLKVKEVDLNEEIESYFKGFGKFPSIGIDDCIDIAKHFFELGLKAQKGEKV